MEITNYKLIEFMNQSSELVREYIVILRHLKPRETKRRIMFMKLKHVDKFKKLLNSGSDRDLIFIVSKVQEINEEDVLDLSIIEFFGLAASVREQIETIIKAEENGLTPSYIDPKWKIVNGSEKMEKYGIYNTLDHLTGKKPHLYDHYKNMEYAEIFTILRKWKEEADLQHEMSQIKTKTE